MINKNRKLTDLRDSVKGRLYIFLKDDAVCKKFYEQAEAEGFRFGKNKPTESPMDNIVALEKNKQMSFVGYVGRVQFQAGQNLTRIDYEKFANGETDFNYNSVGSTNTTEIKGKYCSEVVVVGDNHKEAATHIEGLLADCESKDNEILIYKEVERLYDVIVVFDNED